MSESESSFSASFEMSDTESDLEPDYGENEFITKFNSQDVIVNINVLPNDLKETINNEVKKETTRKWCEFIFIMEDEVTTDIHIEESYMFNPILEEMRFIYKNEGNESWKLTKKLHFCEKTIYTILDKLDDEFHLSYIEEDEQHFIELMIKVRNPLTDIDYKKPVSFLKYRNEDEIGTFVNWAKNCWYLL